MKTLTIALAGTLLATTVFLAGCNDDAAPVANGSDQPTQVAIETAAPDASAAATPAPEIAPLPAPPASESTAPSGRLVRQTALAPRTATRAAGAVRGRIDTFYDELGHYGSWVRHPDFSYVWLPH